MAHLPIRREALTTLTQTRQQKRGQEVLAQMFAYFDFADLPFIEQDERADYNRAA